MKYLLSAISTIFISSSLLAIAGKAGPGCCLNSCRTNCDQHQSVTTSEYNGCIKKCDEHFAKIALETTSVPSVEIAQIFPKKDAPKAPKSPPAKATVKTASTVKKEAAAPKKQDTTPKA